LKLKPMDAEEAVIKVVDIWAMGFASMARSSVRSLAGVRSAPTPRTPAGHEGTFARTVARTFRRQLHPPNGH
jgi:hypothetical protein